MIFVAWFWIEIGWARGLSLELVNLLSLYFSWFSLCRSIIRAFLIVDLVQSWPLVFRDELFEIFLILFDLRVQIFLDFVLALHLAVHPHDESVHRDVSPTPAIKNFFPIIQFDLRLIIFVNERLVIAGVSTTEFDSRVGSEVMGSNRQVPRKVLRVEKLSYLDKFEFVRLDAHILGDASGLFLIFYGLGQQEVF